MSIEKVKAYFATLGREKEVMEFPVSSATVELAAQALSVEPARIAKTLSFQGEDENHCILIVTAGDAKIDNSKFRHFFKYAVKAVYFPLFVKPRTVYARQIARGIKDGLIK